MPILSFFQGRKRSTRNDQLRTDDHHNASWSDDEHPPPYESKSKFHDYQPGKREKDEYLNNEYENATHYTTYNQGSNKDCHNVKGEKPKPYRDQPAQARPLNSEEPPEFTGEDDEKLLAYYLPKLSEYDTIILLDDSSSMVNTCGFKRSAECYSSPSRWEMVRELIGDLARSIAEIDEDGIDVHFLNNVDASGANLKRREDVEALFRPPAPRKAVTPNGYTFIGKRLEGLFRAYEESADADPFQQPKKVNYIVFTDGEASDKVVVEHAIERHARWLDSRNYPEDQVGIQFFQIGNDLKAKQYLQELDDTMKGRGVRDIVDTTQYVGGDLTVLRIIKICVGGVNKRLDQVRLSAMQ